MRIESIIIKNYRQYQDVEFDFQKVDGHPDVHIILGSNGVGKTNVLNAITWCLYEKELHLGDTNSAKPRINSQYVKDLKARGETLGEVGVEVYVDAEEEKRKIRFIRKEQYSLGELGVQALQSKLTVQASNPSYLDGWEILTQQEDTYLYVSKYVPESINEYIFFDGEQLEHYFQNAANIKKGINELTQASLLEKTHDKYREYIKAQLEPQLANGSDAAISECQKKIADVEVKIKNQKDTINAIEVELEKCNAAIVECDRIIQGHSELRDKNKALQEREASIDRLEKNRKDKQAELMNFIREYYILLAIYPKMKEYYDFIINEENLGNLPPKIDKKLLDDCIKGQKCLVCGSPLDGSAIKKIGDLMERLSMASATSAELNKTMTALQAYFAQINQYKTRRDHLVNDLKDIENRKKKDEDEADGLRKYIHAIAGSDEITKAIDDKDTYKGLQDRQRENLGVQKETLKLQEEEEVKLEKEMDLLLAKNGKYKNVVRQKSYCERAAKILEETRLEILEDCRNKMQSATYEQFCKLMWKKGMFSKVEISSGYTFSLIDRYGDQALGSCSAAERALLALSFTLALQETSKHDSLLFIDTPIGRVDSDNRSNFMNVLMDVAKDKQVILTFTPTEYDANIRTILGDRYSTLSELVSTDGLTTI